MEFQRPLCLFFLLFITLLSSSQATKFNVVGDGSWTPNPSENYNQWSGRNRFQINDSLVFKYQKGTDSVLQVTKDDYDKCNKTNPLKKFDNGNTEFPLDRPGAFYFISGQDGNCEKGQKLVVVVITPRGNTKPVSPAPTTAPIPSPPSPRSVTPSPAVKPPTSSPPTPAATSPSPSPAVSTPPAAGGPVATPATSPAVSTPPAAGGPVATPATSPSMSPEVSTPPSAGGPPAPSPMGTSPDGSPLSPSGTAGSANAPGANAPGTNGTAPPPANSAPSVTPSGFLVLSVTIVVGAMFMR